ncbi:MAG: PilZN3 domain-containing protein [Treponemataceae bacterium]
MLTKEELDRHYTTYLNKEIVLTKELVKTIGLDAHQVQIKCGSTQWPCIINSTSLANAKFIIGIKSGAYGMLIAEDVGFVSLKFHFVRKDEPALVIFVQSKIVSIQPYIGSKDFAIVELEYTERPSDDFIQIFCSTIEANQNYANRREERILITEESKKIMSLKKEETVAFIQHVPRHCIIRDISFSGAKIFLMGLSSFLVGKIILVRFDFLDPKETFNLKGVIVASEEISGRKELVSASIKFDTETVPMSYKMHISNYLTALNAKNLNQK